MSDCCISITRRVLEILLFQLLLFFFVFLNINSLNLEDNGACTVIVQHNNLSAGTRTFKPGTRGAELVSELNVVSGHIFTKSKSNALTSEAFAAFIQEHGISEFYIVGADAAACIKSTCFNMRKGGYAVHVLSDCITSYDKKKLPEMLAYYESKGCSVTELSDAMQAYAENGDIEHEKAV